MAETEPGDYIVTGHKNGGGRGVAARFQMTSSFAVFRARLAARQAGEPHRSPQQPASGCQGLVGSLPRASVTYLHRSGNLNQQNFIFSHFRKPEFKIRMLAGQCSL